MRIGNKKRNQDISVKLASKTDTLQNRGTHLTFIFFILCSLLYGER